MLAVILVAEVLFWTCLLSGLLARYKLHMPKVGLALLFTTPIIDLGLLAYAFYDLSATHQAGFFHGFAAFYVAFSLVFGLDTIQAADHKFRGTSELHREGFARSTASNVVRCGIAAALTATLLVGLMLVTGTAGSFWLMYWLVATLFTPLEWWLIDRRLQKRRNQANP